MNILHIVVIFASSTICGGGEMDREYIQEAAHWVHEGLWENKEALWPGGQPPLLSMLDPAVAASLLGLTYLELPTLGSTRFAPQGQKFQAAGIFDRCSGKIAVSTEFPLHERRFTAAHEIGHFLLHEQEIMHRDRPIGGYHSLSTKPLIEREADYFAACFLMPPKLVIARFESQFGCKGQFHFNDVSCFHLNANDPNSLLYASQNSLDREIALARCTRFNGKAINSLAQQFRISDSAMAVRIKELNLVRWP
ncbi:ImmA/IrrE family metallo-endopeptidase [Pseudomonas chlororaphis]|uniref:ImmA/IrrE family metallo-endopeptidase n=1 Tax=Pseudomonas chlororaphis TaxID=587753 RepID=UPI0021824594|nr:ImmA/IrrE family metallo-endopeptidase [Pseudomonas chlororaphis]WDH37943.1 ImmA/IrrE family metallo-endopeptidase [Pseudomonas chlororaphis]WDH44030.1 ImmA/IrrE family metallo-endopeptidase [Pseudomonas chlororaphis]